MLDLGPAADGVIGLVAGVSDELLTGATPCAETSVAGLLDHFMGLTLAFTWAARKSTPPGDRGRTPHGWTRIGGPCCRDV
jgi:hypothetical protein